MAVQRRRSWTVLLALLSALALCAKAEDSNCLYKYTDHLNHNPTCSPFSMGVMWLECTVEVPLEATNITVGWFFNCQQLQNDSLVVIVSETQLDSSIRRIISRLTINDIGDDYAGDYTCNILGDEEYIPSDIFMLSDQEYLEVSLALGPCSNNGDVLFNTMPTGEKCADITENRTIPLSLSCKAPPSTTSQQLHVTSTPVPIRRTPSPPLPSNPPHPTSSSSSSSSPSTTHTQHTVINTPSSSPRPTSSAVPSPSGPTVSTSSAVPSPSGPTVSTSSTTSDPNSSVFYIVVSVAAFMLLVIVVLLVVCVCMCVRGYRSRKSMTVKQQGVDSKQRDSMQPNAGYEGDVDSPYPLSGAHPNSHHPIPHCGDTSDYNTIAMVDYETVGPGGRLGPGSDYQRLQRPTLTPSMMTRFVSSPEATVFTPSTSMTSMYRCSLTTLDDHPTKTSNGRAFGAVPPPLPSTARPGNLGKMANSPESTTTIDSPFQNGSAGVDACSPLERGRIDSTSLLLPHDRKGCASTMMMMPSDFEGLYSPRGHPGQRLSPSSPRVNHPLEKIPETGASFPEPQNPYPFPESGSCTYESIPGETSDSPNNLLAPGGVKGYERPLHTSSHHHHHHHHQAITLPVNPPPPPPPGPSLPDSQGRQTLHGYGANHSMSRQINGGGGGAAAATTTFSPHHHHHHHHQLQEREFATPIYHSLEQSNDMQAHRSHNGIIVSELKEAGMAAPVYPETASYTTTNTTMSSDSSSVTPAFPVLSADFAEVSPQRRLGSGGQRSMVQPERTMRVSNEPSSDFTGDSDYPGVDDNITDCTGGSSTTAYPESDWTAGYSTTGGGDGGGEEGGTFTGNPNLFQLNGGPLPRSGSSTSSSSHATTASSADGRRRHFSNGGTSSRPSSSETTMNNRPMSNGSINNNMSPPNGNCSIMVQYPRVPAGSSHTVPLSGVSGVSNLNGPASHTMDQSRQNNYKKLDPSTMEPHLKYTRLNVGKLTPV